MPVPNSGNPNPSSLYRDRMMLNTDVTWPDFCKLWNFDRVRSNGNVVICANAFDTAPTKNDSIHPIDNSSELSVSVCKFTMRCR